MHHHMVIGWGDMSRVYDFDREADGPRPMGLPVSSASGVVLFFKGEMF